MAQFWAYQVVFSIGDGLFLCGGRLMVPASLRKHVPSLIYDGHLGVNRYRAIARGAVWWPTMGSQIKTMVENCPNCATKRVQRAEPLLPTVTPSRPWERVGVDIFHHEGADYLLLVDYYSRYTEVLSLRSTTSTAMISIIKSVFARHGISETRISDIGP
ncbi:uncharacterized protein K02A2.6-like [Rhipicephalus sanguineus]|uniref:uncharacterized protein K02A2.6-like n=1 Tax=Rhipicephalus sanguineus TaxID=34632 RepID=UPI0020C412BA|nr:uncharacterized protein K02A2.6-like [Rhipicephalus sanguineus]